MVRAPSLRSDRAPARARSLHRDGAEWAFGRHVVTDFWLGLGRYVATERSTRLVAAYRSFSSSCPMIRLGFIKCNVGSSWDASSHKCGAAWIVRDHHAIPLLHSRRAFSSVFSPFEADLFSIMWSLEALRDLHTTKVIHEVSFAEAWKAFISPEKFPNVSYVLSRLRIIANDFEHFQLLLSPPGINSAALSIALSVTKDRRYQSYMARGGPSWLSSYLRSEASGGSSAS
uniref:RNase H type-1 domain-containing protein n=1 Tax=Brassica oleracea TaxID=3712 RepID=A0A3P6E9S2_BRAOL|nr:unnamed protein product [Brassica oleracea]